MNNINGYEKALEFWRGEAKKSDVYSREYLAFVDAEIRRWENRISDEIKKADFDDWEVHPPFADWRFVDSFWGGERHSHEAPPVDGVVADAKSWSEVQKLMMDYGGYKNGSTARLAFQVMVTGQNNRNNIDRVFTLEDIKSKVLKAKKIRDATEQRRYEFYSFPFPIIRFDLYNVFDTGFSVEIIPADCKAMSAKIIKENQAQFCEACYKTARRFYRKIGEIQFYSIKDIVLMNNGFIRVVFEVKGKLDGSNSSQDN